jgi:PadR family transcriptional regulator PadR
MAKDTLGEFEHLVLLAILQVGGGAYGVPVMDEIQQRTGRRVAPAAVYVTLRRLEENGLIRSRLEDPAEGKPRRFVQVTGRGLSLLRSTRRAITSMWEGLGPVLEER